jgi:hypothetical protein
MNMSRKVIGGTHIAGGVQLLMYYHRLIAIMVTPPIHSFIHSLTHSRTYHLYTLLVMHYRNIHLYIYSFLLVDRFGMLSYRVHLM